MGHRATGRLVAGGVLASALALAACGVRGPPQPPTPPNVPPQISPTGHTVGPGRPPFAAGRNPDGGGILRGPPPPPPDAGTPDGGSPDAGTAQDAGTPER